MTSLTRHQFDSPTCSCQAISEFAKAHIACGALALERANIRSVVANVENPAVPQSRSYRLEPARFAGLRRRMIIGVAIVGPLMLAGIWYLDGRFESKHRLFDFVFLPLMLVWVSYRSIQRERRKWDALVLELSDACLIRRLPDFPPLDMVPNAVTTIVESSRGINIQTNSRLKTLFVSNGLLDYDDFRSRLAAWAPTARVVQATPSVRASITAVASVLWCILMFGGPLYLMYTPYRELVLPLGIGLVIGLVATILYYQGSPNMPSSAKYGLWVLLLLPLLAIITRLY